MPKKEGQTKRASSKNKSTSGQAEAVSRVPERGGGAVRAASGGKHCVEPARLMRSASGSVTPTPSRLS
jgi:hypothetical protein